MTQEPLDRFASNFDWGPWDNHGKVLSLVLRFFVEWIDYYSEKLVPR